MIDNLTGSDAPAAKAGLKREDVITAVNDRLVASGDDLRLMIAETPPGTKVKISYLRAGKANTVDVTLGHLDDANGAEGEWLPGVTVAPLTDQIRKEMKIAPGVEGIVITEIGDQTPYSEVFPVGAVIEQINRIPVTDLASAKQALRDGRNMASISYRGVFRYVLFYVR